jgi:hypothetical protein
MSLQASRLCTACGLCCNGAMFSRAKAAPEEVDRIGSYGLDVIERTDGAWFKLPCSLLEGGSCTIYADRFSVCRGFSCILLKRLRGGEIGLEEGLELVVTAKEMIAGLGERDPSAATLEGRARIREAGPGGEAKMTNARLHLDTVVLDLFLDKHFRNEKVMTDDSPDRSAEGATG